MPRRLPLLPVQVTDADMAAAYTRHRRRTWPATLDAALADPLYAGLVRLHAIEHLRRQQRLQARQAARITQAAAMTGARRWPFAVDHKRAAANDRDDDTPT